MNADSNAAAPLRVTHLIEKGFKRIDSIDVQPGSRTLIMLQGPNENGKTSALDGLIAALGGKSRTPEAPVKKGHESSTVEVIIGDDSGPKYKAVRTFSPDGASTLRLYDATNPDRPAKISAGQTKLDSLIADISFDPLAFMRADEKNQIAMLMAAAGMREKYDELQRQRAGVMDSRRDLNRDIERERGRIAGMPQYPEAKARCDGASIEAEIHAAEDHNAAIDKAQNNINVVIATVKREKDGYENTKTSFEREIAECEARIQKLKAGLEEETRVKRNILQALKAEHDEAAAKLASLGEKKTIAEVSSRLEQIRTTNAQCDANDARAAAEAKLKEQEARAEKMTATLAAIDAESVTLLEKSTIGQAVPGLEIRDGGIWHNGVPLGQASGMRKLELSALIGMAGNAQLRVMCIDEADKMDDEALSRLVTLAKERKYQLWATAVRVGSTADDVMVLPIRNGIVEHGAEKGTGGKSSQQGAATNPEPETVEI